MLKIITGILLSTVIIFAFLLPPPQKELGEVSRIFYFHVPFAWVAVLAFFMSMINSILYLKNHYFGYDIKAACASRLGFLFCFLALLSGSIFAKYSWGTFWNWDPRQTSVFILILIYGAYFALRSAIDNEKRRAVFASVYSILAFCSVPFFVFVVPRVFQSLHPTDSIIDASFRLQLPFKLLVLFLTSVLGFSFLFLWIYKLEVSLLKISFEKEKRSGYEL